MRLLFPNPVSILLAIECTVVVLEVADSFSPPPPPPTTTTCARRGHHHRHHHRRSPILLLSPHPSSAARSSSPSSSSSSTAVHAKPKSKAKDAALAALDAIDRMESSSSSPSSSPASPASSSSSSLDLLLLESSSLVEEPLTKKEQMELEKKRAKEAKRANAEAERNAAANREEGEKDARKKALRALAEMEAAERGSGSVVVGDGDGDGLSKKEAKMAAKRAEKEAEKTARKDLERRAKKLGISAGELGGRDGAAGAAAGDGAPAAGDGPAAKKGPPNYANGEEEEGGGGSDGVGGDDGGGGAESPDHVTAEERIRKERPPPRVRVMESSQPDYTALRLEDVAITFRDQAVLRSATWGVQTGDRVGLVGANGAGKTTQLRVLAGELEPTAGDVVKSHASLRVSMLRQEFVDEMITTRTLREEFRSVFEEEAGIMSDLSDAEIELENMAGGADDGIADRMQEVLDRMAELQAKADAKGVAVLDSKVSKIMDLMGFDPEEGGE